MRALALALGKPEGWLRALLAGATGLSVYFPPVADYFDPDYAGARGAILPGLTITIRSTLIAFLIAVLIGLIAGLGRIARRVHEMRDQRRGVRGRHAARA